MVCARRAGWEGEDVLNHNGTVKRTSRVCVARLALGTFRARSRPHSWSQLPPLSWIRCSHQVSWAYQQQSFERHIHHSQTTRLAFHSRLLNIPARRL